MAIVLAWLRQGNFPPAFLGCQKHVNAIKANQKYETRQTDTGKQRAATMLLMDEQWDNPKIARWYGVDDKKTDR